MIKMENKVPFVYVNKSRDFQLLCRMLSVIQNGIKSDIDDMLNIIDTDNIHNQLLNLLASKVGYFPEFQLDNFALRIICDGFPYMIKNKGNIVGIRQAVNMFLKINKINLTSDTAQVNIEFLTNDSSNSYTLIITLPIEFKLLDLKILESLLEYILPTGCIVKYLFEKRI